MEPLNLNSIGRLITVNAKQDQIPTMANQQSAMDETQEKLENLKSLSVLLLKETIDRQQQVESLLQVKESLEIQLGHIAAEKSVPLETVKGMFSVFMETQMDGIGVSGICQQKDQLCKKESNLLREKVIELEEKKILLEEKIRKLNEISIDSFLTIGNLMEQMDSKERLIKHLNTELMDKDGLIETLLREKEKIEDFKVSMHNEFVKLQESIKILAVPALLVGSAERRVMEMEKEVDKLELYETEMKVMRSAYRSKEEEVKEMRSAYRSKEAEVKEMEESYDREVLMVMFLITVILPSCALLAMFWLESCS